MANSIQQFNQEIFACKNIICSLRLGGNAKISEDRLCNIFTYIIFLTTKGWQFYFHFGRILKERKKVFQVAVNTNCYHKPRAVYRIPSHMTYSAIIASKHAHLCCKSTKLCITTCIQSALYFCFCWAPSHYKKMEKRKKSRGCIIYWKHDWFRSPIFESAANGTCWFVSPLKTQTSLRIRAV